MDKPQSAQRHYFQHLQSSAQHRLGQGSRALRAVNVYNRRTIQFSASNYKDHDVLERVGCGWILGQGVRKSILLWQFLVIRAVLTQCIRVGPSMVRPTNQPTIVILNRETSYLSINGGTLNQPITTIINGKPQQFWRYTMAMDKPIIIDLHLLWESCWLMKLRTCQNVFAGADCELLLYKFMYWCFCWCW